MKAFEEDSLPTLGFPDGMAIDTEDNIWVANFDGGRVTKWDPKEGECYSPYRDLFCARLYEGQLKLAMARACTDGESLKNMHTQKKSMTFRIIIMTLMFHIHN